jgi:hypothetical protein
MSEGEQMAKIKYPAITNSHVVGTLVQVPIVISLTAPINLVL